MLREIVERRRDGRRFHLSDDGARIAAALREIRAARPMDDGDWIPWVVELCASGPESDAVRACGEELARLAPQARSARGANVMARALSERYSFERFGGALDPSAPRTPVACAIALAVLLPLFEEERDRRGRPTGRPAHPNARRALDRDEWVHAIAALREDDTYGELAHGILHDVPAARVPPLPPEPAPASPRGDALSRYRAGEHVAAWQSLADLGRLGSDAREEARAVAREMMQIVRANAETIVEVLQAAGYPFRDEPLAEPVAVGREMRDLVATLGGPLPVSLEAFWDNVGAIDLCRPEEGADCDLDDGESFLYRNPLLVRSPEGGRWCVDDWKENRRRAPWLWFEFSSDDLHKEWTSGGQGWVIRIPSERADGRVHGEPHELDFVPYLRLNFEHCGFLGYEREPNAAAYRRLVERVKKRLVPF